MHFINARDPTDIASLARGYLAVLVVPKGCCAAKGSEEIMGAIKRLAYKRGLKGKVRVNKAGCLDACETGVSAVFYPHDVWYQKITLADVDEIVERTLCNGEIIERLVRHTHPRSTPTP